LFHVHEVTVTLSDVEAGVAAGRSGVSNVEVFDPCAGRAVPHFVLEPLERLRFSLRRDFDATVREVAHPAVQAFADCSSLGEKTEADALNASADNDSSRQAHAGGRAIISRVGRRAALEELVTREGPEEGEGLEDIGLSDSSGSL
jgi:hypothetical protein